MAEAYFIEEKSIPENLIAAGSFDTLVAAVGAAGLVDTLLGPGPFTLFAPTDDAFAALPAGTVEGLLNDIPALTNILLYHVVSGAEVVSGDIAAGPVMMANGSPASLSVDSGVMIETANVIDEHPDTVAAMRAAYDPGMREVYRDKYCIVAVIRKRPAIFPASFVA